MDNITHSLAGLAAGTLIHRSLPDEADPAQQQARHRLLLVSGWAACNFPDLDLVLTRLLPAPLGYLLHHRGHTHTLLYALPQALLLAALLWLLWFSARRVLAASRHACLGLGLAIVAGLLLHMLMDYMNSYGIHPFYPFDARWLYGDMVFIVEPVFWVVLGVPLAMMANSKLVRWVLLALIAATPIVFTSSKHLHWVSAAALLALGALFAVAQDRARPHSRTVLLAAFGACLTFAGIQAAASSYGRGLIATEWRARDPGAQTVDVAMSAFPSNPLCWSVVSVERQDAAGLFRLRRGVLSLAPSVMPASACPAGFAELDKQQTLTPALALVWQQETPLADLRGRQASSCHFDAWLRFARTPAMNAADATDVRYGVDPARNFSTIRYADFAGAPCPSGVPAWGHPREDLLQPKL
ncbi:metal-dependent hydrolase [Massilia cavernae]|uniref:Metal-dependent hydrolase n=1 Tax=Massilia cavernae TaxID=2320864 RepID=A0A418Y8D0_9BURK|nr:metal-dependent hydrolase [Massilia cavernae]RJG27457.1 metal-dependent hydrolase [Massilia cavernae]